MTDQQERLPYRVSSQIDFDSGLTIARNEDGGLAIYHEHHPANTSWLTPEQWDLLVVRVNRDVLGRAE